MNSKNKNILLVVGFALSLLLCYNLAVSETIQLKKEFNRLKKEKELYSNLPIQLSHLNLKQKHYDSILASNQLKGSSIQNSLLRTVNSIAKKNDIIVTSFMEPHRITKNDLSVITYNFTLEGDYNAILKLVHILEMESKFGEIINLHFEKKKNFRSGRNYLQATVLLKSFG